MVDVEIRDSEGVRFFVPKNPKKLLTPRDGSMGKAKAGAGKAAAKAAKKAKQEKMAERRANKQQKKSGGGKNSAGVNEEDLDAILEQYRAEWEAQHANAEEHVGVVPSRRANATLTPCPLGNDLWLYGGEYFDGDKCVFYQDLFRYIPDKNEWRSYSSRTQPGPRSAHQMVASPAGGGQLWVFGGEFASTKQTSFHHYRDLWVYSIAERVWERIDTKVRPSARSGHRMAMWKQFIVLFGGFVDTGVRTTYLQDLWVFDTLEYKWKEIKQNDLRRPPARSGFSFLPTPEGIVLYGGYCKKYVKGQRTQGMALEDAWLLRMDEDTDKIEWIKRRKIGYAPNPPRSGCTMALWGNRNMGVLFGGVTDTEDDEESLESTFWNDLFGYQLSGTGRWISLNLRRPKKRTGADEDGSDAATDDPRSMLPLVRYNSMLAVQRNTLYIYGGIFESGDREYTLDDFYTIDLSKMNQVVCLKDCPIDKLEWHESDDDDDDDDDDDESDDESVPDVAMEPEGVEDVPMEEENVEDELAGLQLDEDLSPEMRAELEHKLALRRQATAFLGVSMDAQRTEEDAMSTPAPGEVLQTFYLRTKHYWAALAYEQSEGVSRGKQLRRDGFDLAEKRYLEYKPMLEEIERIRAEAGLDADEASATQMRRPTGPGAESRHRR